MAKYDKTRVVTIIQFWASVVNSEVGTTNHKSEVDKAEIMVIINNHFFLLARRSASAPASGDAIAIVSEQAAIIQLHQTFPKISFGATACTKKIEKTNVVCNVGNGDIAQSYKI